MKQYLIISLIWIIPFFGYAQSTDSTGRFGITINSSMNGEVYPIRIVPSVTYTKGISQLELGFGVHPFIRKDQKILSGELNYKCYPNGINNKFNMYFIARLSYLYNKREFYYPSTYNYLFLNAGYGFEINSFKKVYLGTNMSVGTFTYSKNSEVPYESFASKKIFEEFGFNLAFQFNVGYRF